MQMFHRTLLAHHLASVIVKKNENSKDFLCQCTMKNNKLEIRRTLNKIDKCIPLANLMNKI